MEVFEPAEWHESPTENVDIERFAGILDESCDSSIFLTSSFTQVFLIDLSLGGILALEAYLKRDPFCKNWNP